MFRLQLPIHLLAATAGMFMMPRTTVMSRPTIRCDIYSKTRFIVTACGITWCWRIRAKVLSTVLASLASKAATAHRRSWNSTMKHSPGWISKRKSGPVHASRHANLHPKYFRTACHALCPLPSSLLPHYALRGTQTVWSRSKFLTPSCPPAHHPFMP